MEGIDTLLRYISWGLVIIGPILLVSQLTRGNESTSDAVVGTVAALVGMVPEGLVLLTSIAFFVGALSLARRKVLVQELPAVEGLARVDVVCLDKTGTLTDGAITFAAMECVEGMDEDRAAVAMARPRRRPAPERDPRGAGRGVHAVGGLGADRVRAVLVGPQVERRHLRRPRQLGDGRAGDRPRRLPARPRASAPGSTRCRTRASGCSWWPTPMPRSRARRCPRVWRPSPSSRSRSRSARTPRRRCGTSSRRASASRSSRATTRGPSGPWPSGSASPTSARPVDARSLPDDPTELAAAVNVTTVFGRVTPNQKRAFVHALQQRAHVVAMTGDGVNDALALKDADIGVAMGNGAPATRAVAQIVLLDGRFSVMPRVVAEGRRVIANIERVASLFLIKNVYSAVLAVVVAVVAVPYPFLPRHLTLVSTLTIGLPAFVLSLAPSNERYRPGFLRRVLAVSVPAGVITATAVFGAYALARAENVRPDEARTAGTIVAMIVGLFVLVLVAQPLVAWKIGLIAAMGGLFVLAMAIPGLRRFFALYVPATVLAEAIAIGVAAGLVVTVVWREARRRLDRPTAATAATAAVAATRS